MSQQKKSSLTATLHPPPGFAFVEDCLCRCSAPLGIHALPFLASISLTTVINFSGKPLDIALDIESTDIVLHDLFAEGDDPFRKSTVEAGEWVKNALEQVLSSLHSGCVLLVGSPTKCYDCVVTACLRRLQSWSLVAIFGEFRMHSGPHKFYDLEQFIEHFDPSVVDLGSPPPEFLSVHFHLLHEEEKLVERIHKRRLHASAATIAAQCKGEGEGEGEGTDAGAGADQASPTRRKGAPVDSIGSASSGVGVGVGVGGEGGQTVQTSRASERKARPHRRTFDFEFEGEGEVTDGEEQRRIDDILFQLFFSSPCARLSPNSYFDPALSLINDKEDDD